MLLFRKVFIFIVNIWGTRGQTKEKVLSVMHTRAALKLRSNRVCGLRSRSQDLLLFGVGAGGETGSGWLNDILATTVVSYGSIRALEKKMWRSSNWWQKVSLISGLWICQTWRTEQELQDGLHSGLVVLEVEAKRKVCSSAEKWTEKRVNGTQGGSLWINRAGDSPFLGWERWRWAGVWGTKLPSLPL